MRNTGQYQFETACAAAELTVNGSAPHDPQIHAHDAPKFYEAIRKNPYLALGEGYAAKHYDVQNLGGMVQKLIEAEMRGDLHKILSLEQKLTLGKHYLGGRLNLNRFRRKQWRIATDHYDLDNELYETMLGPSMKYTSAFYYPQYGEFDLELYQELDLYMAGLRMGLKEGDTVCDWGFGFGPNTKFFVEKFGVKVTGITISEEQHAYAQHVCRDISDSVNLILMDYRDVTPEKLGTFDHVCFFEMIESIGGPKNFSQFFQIIKSILNEDGDVFGQILSRNMPSTQQKDWIDRSHATDPMTDKYTFTGGVLGRIGTVTNASEQAGLFPELIDNTLGRANSETCKAWDANLGIGWEELRDSPDHGLGITKGEKYMEHFRARFPYEININTFRRLQGFYLQSCSGVHEAGLVNDGHYTWQNNPTKKSRPNIQVPQTREEVLALLGS